MQESTLQNTALQARQRLEQRLEAEQSNVTPSEDCPIGDPQLTSAHALDTANGGLPLNTISTNSSVNTESPDISEPTPNQTPAASAILATARTIPSWMTEAQKRFEKVFNAPNHKSITELWLEFEKLLGYPEDRKIRLTNQSRPQQLSDWMQRHRMWDKAPPVEKASEFGATWKGWWKILQPQWRIPDDECGGSLVRNGPPDEQWPNLLKGGGNGFVLVLLSLSWWMMREKDENRKAEESSSAFEDVQWVLQQMVRVLRTQHEQGGEDDNENNDPNTRPTKR
jgi:hypothetical protein